MNPTFKIKKPFVIKPCKDYNPQGRGLEYRIKKLRGYGGIKT